jgi:hypothetical protein
VSIGAVFDEDGIEDCEPATDRVRMTIPAGGD